LRTPKGSVIVAFIIGSQALAVALAWACARIGALDDCFACCRIIETVIQLGVVNEIPRLNVWIQQALALAAFEACILGA
jgi:hypothetical protein